MKTKSEEVSKDYENIRSKYRNETHSLTEEKHNKVYYQVKFNPMQPEIKLPMQKSWMVAR